MTFNAFEITRGVGDRQPPVVEDQETPVAARQQHRLERSAPRRFNNWWFSRHANKLIYHASEK